ncbi:LysE family translocator [Streptomyces sp. NPDC050161]|uniref:LysE family translocator n=1 Tax=Streptomyces sp. NPDC050161 TaxID=3365604 RepID=UPI0037A0213F
MLTSLLGFTVVAGLLTISPGPDFAVVLRTALGSGRRAALCSALGIAAGCFVWGLAGAVGLTAMLSASQLAYDVLRAAGALYLMWLGFRALRGARRMRRAPGTARRTAGTGRPGTAAAHGDDGQGAERDGAAGPPETPRRAFRTGLLTNVLNPKVGVVYMSLLPQFIPHGAPVVTTTLLLVAVHAALGVLWLGAVALAVHRARAVLQRPRVRQRLDQATGGVLLALGAAVGWEAAR